MIFNFVITAICLMLVHAGTSNVISIDGNTTLASVCSDTDTNDTVIQLNASMVHYLTVNCVFDNNHNLTLRGPAVINCTYNGSLSFINSFHVILSSVDITNCGTTNLTFRQANDLQLPKVLKEQLIAVLFINCVNVTITNVTMTYNLGINLVGINVLGNSLLYNVTIQNIEVLRDSNLTSSAAIFEFRANNIYSNNCNQPSCHSLHINNSLFLNNTNTLPEEVLNYFSSYIIPFENPYISSPVVVPGLTVGFFQNDTYNISVLVSNTRFIRNHGRFGGGLYVGFASPVRSYSMKIDNCTFQENAVGKQYIQTSYGAGIIAMSFYYGHMHNRKSSLSLSNQNPQLLVINNSNFTDNSAVVGTCIYLYLFVNGHPAAITMENLTFINNKGDVATAVYAEDHLLYEKASTIHVTMTNIIAKNNQLVHATSQDLKPLSDVNGLFVFFNVKNVLLQGSSNCFLNNTPGVMGLSRTDIRFDGNFHFSNNTSPTDGGAIYLTAGSTMIINNNSCIHFQNNHANRTGGAIYSDSSEGFAVLAAVCPIQFNMMQQNHIHVIFSSNTAYHGGNSIFGSQLYPCGWFPSYGSLPYDESVKDLYNRTFTFQPVSYEACNCSNNCSSTSNHDITPHKLYNDSNDCFSVSDREVTSTAHQVCFCNNTFPKICCKTHSISVSPDKEGTFCLMVVDHEKSPLFSEVHFLQSDIANPTKVTVYPYCTKVNVNFTGRPNTNVTVLLRPSVPLYTEGVNLTIHFNDCFVGFKRGNNSCLCDAVLKHRKFCDDRRGLTIPPGAWMNYSGQSLYFHSYCDVAYCKYSSTVIDFNESTSVCRNHRDGILCGKCVEGYSVVFGSQDCYDCHNYALVSILGYAIVGIVVVFMLSFLKLTVDKGIINGVIFYANIIYINHNLFYRVNIKVLPNIFNTISLDPPTGVCFYQGMTALSKYTLEFFFPIYLWLLVLLVVMLIKKFPRVSHIIQSPPQLLATLIYLSYSKLLLVINYIVKGIKVSEIQSSGDDSSSIRWYQDPNVAYSNAWHVVMVIVSLLLFFIFLLPFAVIVTFPNYCLGSRYLIHFKPIIDSYTAPYKDKWAFWLGIHLLMLIVFYTLLTIQQLYGNPKDLLLIILLFVIPLTGVQLYCKPYKSRWVNLLDTLFLANLIMGGCVILWITNDDGEISSHKETYFKIVVYVCLAVAALEVVVIALYHVIMVTSSGQLLMIRMYQLVCCMNDTVALDTFSEHSYGHQPVKLSYSEDQPLLDGNKDAPPRFRESFLEYENLITPRSHS